VVIRVYVEVLEATGVSSRVGIFVSLTGIHAYCGTHLHGILSVRFKAHFQQPSSHVHHFLVLKFTSTLLVETFII
jgi:hypothetical protein